MVKAYLLNVINQKDVVLNKIPCVKRNDLTIVPDILIYDKVESNNICTFQNKLGITLSYTLMGEYNCIQDALNVYQNGTADYTKAYDKLTSVKTVKEDFTWNMLILVDPTIEKEEISYNYILLKRIDLQDIETFLFFDACMIFETLKVIKVYIESFGNKSKLTKRENRFLGYYLEIVTSISKPELYLVNSNEIKFMKTYYEIWNIQQIAESLVVSINATIDVFSFVFQYEAAKKDKLSSFLFSFLTIILGFTALYDFFENNEIVRKWLIIIFGIWGLGLLSLGMYRLIVFIKDEISNYLKK